jgi:hypothetical protein
VVLTKAVAEEEAVVVQGNKTTQTIPLQVDQVMLQ